MLILKLLRHIIMFLITIHFLLKIRGITLIYS